NSVEDVRRYVADLDAEKCPVGRRTLELRKEREAELERKRKERETRHKRDEQAQSAESWQTWALNLIDQRIDQQMGLGGTICDTVGKVIGIKSRQVREYAQGEIGKLREELKAIASKLDDKLRDGLDRLHTVNQERRELEQTLNQTNLDARDARIDGAIEV